MFGYKQPCIGSVLKKLLANYFHQATWYPPFFWSNQTRFLCNMARINRSTDSKTSTRYIRRNHRWSHTYASTRYTIGRTYIDGPELKGKEKITKDWRQRIGMHILPLEELKGMIATDQIRQFPVDSITSIKCIMIL